MTAPRFHYLSTGNGPLTNAPDRKETSMARQVQSIMITARHRVFCPLCGTEVDTDPNGDACEHLIYAASDECFEFARPRYLEALGLPADTDGVDIEHAYEELLEATGHEDEVEDGISVGSITEVARLDSEFRIIHDTPMPCGFTGYFGFAPLPWDPDADEEEK